MMLFWTVAGLLALAIGGLLVLALLRARASGGPAAAFDVRVYRDQLKEVDRDLARGTVNDTEAERIRTEVSRRLLDADRAAHQDQDPSPAPRGLTLAVAALIGVALFGALALYNRLGAPGYPDLPLATRIADAEAARVSRPAQAEAEIEMAASLPTLPAADPKFMELMGKLRSAMAERPDDLRGMMLLARNEAMMGNFAAAHAAQSRMIALQGDAATDSDYADLADLLVLAAGGYVSPEAETALRAALERDPQNGAARYYLGLMYVQTGRPDLAFQLWRALMAESTPQAPWMPPIRAQIERVADLAGMRFSLPQVAPAPGPDAADIAAASDMSDEDRNAMIRTMVDGLGARLASEGGSPEEWARLINALGVLKESERAAAVWAEAQQTFAASPEALATIRAAALAAGVVE